jgi:hypothetical protein
MGLTQNKRFLANANKFLGHVNPHPERMGFYDYFPDLELSEVFFNYFYTKCNILPFYVLYYK